jgi:methyltransferase (TIGR00027 family)
MLAAHHPQWRVLVPRHGIDALTRLNRTALPSGMLSFLVGRWWGRALLSQVEQVVLPGVVLHYLARKRWLEQVVLTALQDGCEQVVILGGGFDTLAWRLHSAWPATVFCELDHPGTQRGKAAALSPGAASNLYFRPTDLTRELPSTSLRQLPAFDSQRCTCFVAEGLLMYFQLDRVTTILRDLAGFAPNSTLAFTFMERGPDGRAGFRGRQSWIDAWLRSRRESFCWALNPADLDEFLRPLGPWRVSALAGAAELRREVLAPAGLADAALAQGEWLCSAT